MRKNYNSVMPSSSQGTFVNMEDLERGIICFNRGFCKDQIIIIIMIIILFQDDRIFGTNASLTYGPQLQYL